MDMGLGKLGSANLIIKKKHRFTFEITGICGGKSVPSWFIKSAARPSWSTGEIELNFLNATGYYPGKTKYETMTVTYMDTATMDTAPLYNWLASVNNFTDPVKLQQGSKRSDYSGYGILTMYSGCGDPLEQWTYMDVWPTAVNFGDVSMESDENADIELTLRYSAVDFKSLCPGFTITPCCTPCDTTGLGGNFLPNV